MQPTQTPRFEQFSDGVFAIAITLLAIELHVPTFISTHIDAAMRELIPLIPNVLTFILSFVTIAIFWVNHHQLTKHLTTVSRRILWGNVLFLMFLTLIPFATSVVSKNPAHPLAMISYSLIMLGSSVSFSMVRFMIHNGGGSPIHLKGRGLIGPLFYLLAAVSAFVSVTACYVFLSIPPLFYFLPKESK